MSGRHWLKIDRCIFAATIDFEFEFEAITLIEIGHASALDRRDVDEGIWLAIVALNEAEALHCVEELDRTGCLLTRQLTLWAATIATRAACCGPIGSFARRTTILDRKRLAFTLEIGCRTAATTIDKREFEGLTFGEAGEACLFDCRDMDENIFAAIIANDKAETLLAIEEFYDTLAFADNLGRHRRTTTAGTATTAEAITATAAATEPVSAAAKAAATEAITAAEAAATEIIITEAVALVPATALPAAPTIKTHAVQFFPKYALSP